MAEKELISYSLKNLLQNKSRSALTILSIFVGITTIFIFISFGLGLYNYTEEFTTSSSVDKILIQPKGSGAPGLDDTFKLTDKDVEVVGKTFGILESTGVYSKVAEIKQRGKIKYVFLMGYDPEKPLIMDISNIGIREGRLLEKRDNGKVLLGYNYLLDKKIFPNAYDLNDQIIVQGEKLKIVGFLESAGNPQDDSNIYVINDFVKKLYPEEENSYGLVIAQANIEEMDETIERVEKSLRKSRGLEEGKEDFFVQSFGDLLETFSIVLNGIIGFILLIALVSVIVSAINTANTMITSVLERTKEIGVMKAIGARNREIFKIFLFESAFLGFVAGVIGVAVGFLFVFLAASILENMGWGFLSPAYPWTLFAGCILFAVITGAISGTLPALQASKTNVVDALRYE